MPKCLSCNANLNRRNSKFCNNKCQSTYNYTTYIKRWLNNEVDEMRCSTQISKHIRKYLFELNDSKCCICG